MTMKKVPPVGFETRPPVLVPTHFQISIKKLLRSHPNYVILNRMRTPRLRHHAHRTAAVVADDADLLPDDEGLQNPNDFLDEHHPENDLYIKGVEHIQRQIMHAHSQLRTKQVNIIKSIFAGENYTSAAHIHGTSPQTVSKLVKSTNGLRLLNLLQYHLKLIEGPNEAQRRSMLWRIATREEENNPKTTITALEALNKMHFQNKQLDQNVELAQTGASQQTTTVIVNIDQKTLPRGALD